MYYTVFLVLDNLANEAALLDSWERAGVGGITILDSTGLGRIRQNAGLRDDMPLMPNLYSLLYSRGEHHRTFISVIEGDDMIDRIIEATEAVLGDMTVPNRGILFVMPVVRAVGLSPRRQTDAGNKSR